MSAPDLTTLSPANIIPFIAEIFARRGAEEYIGEPVTISEHMLQAAEFAAQSGAEEQVVAAALLHDIGHFTSEFASNAADDNIDNVHEEAGARILKAFFPPLVHDCVRYHVDAKRYLCATDPAYFAKLSEASVHSLNLQGGPMSPDEVTAFETNPHVKAIVQVRIWDDMGKNPDHSAPDFASYQPLLERVVAAHSV